MPKVYVQNNTDSVVQIYEPAVYYKTLRFAPNATTEIELSSAEFGAFEPHFERLALRVVEGGGSIASVRVEDTASSASLVQRPGREVSVEFLELDLSEGPESVQFFAQLICEDSAEFIGGVVRVVSGYVGGSVLVRGGANVSLKGLTIEG